MNLKVPYSLILTLSLLIGLSACASRNQQSGKIHPDVVVSAERNDLVKPETEADLIPPIANEEIKTAQHRPLDILERLRRGFQFSEIESEHALSLIHI